MIRKILFILITVLIAYSYMPGVYIPIDTTFLYEKPDIESYRVLKVNPDMLLHIIERTPRFFYIEVEGTLGWIKRADVKEFDPRETTEKIRRIANYDSIPIFQNHNANSALLGKIEKNSRLLQIDSYNSWRRVLYDDRIIGWVEKKYLINYNPDKHDKTKRELLTEYAEYLIPDNAKLKTKTTKNFGYKPVRTR